MTDMANKIIFQKADHKTILNQASTHPKSVGPVGIIALETLRIPGSTGHH